MKSSNPIYGYHLSIYVFVPEQALLFCITSVISQYRNAQIHIHIFSSLSHKLEQYQHFQPHLRNTNVY